MNFCDFNDKTNVSHCSQLIIYISLKTNNGFHVHLEKCFRHDFDELSIEICNFDFLHGMECFLVGRWEFF